MYQYTVTQWVVLFYFYCFAGWCFESAYVSIRTGKLTNRGFMHGPFLPLYGSGAIMMLVVSAPFQSSIPLTYLAGCIGATILEYVTGVTMEALFKVRYWDYSYKKFQYKGHICLSSTLAWGGLTILMTKGIQRPVEQVLLSIPGQALSIAAFLLTAVLFADFALSFKAAMDLRDLLIKLEKAKAEMGHLQKRLDVVIALTNEEVEARIAEYKDGFAQYRGELAEAIGDTKDHFVGAVHETRENLTEALNEKKAEVSKLFAEFLGDEKKEGMAPGEVREGVLSGLKKKKDELGFHRRELLSAMCRQMKKLFRTYPGIVSNTFKDILEEVRQMVDEEEKHK